VPVSPLSRPQSSGCVQWRSPQDSLTKTISIAETYWFLHGQSRDGWTHELDLRPSMETW